MTETPSQAPDKAGVVEQMDLEGRLRFEASAMRAAVNGEYTPGTFHLLNWQDKPHRVIFDACRLMEEAAAALSPPPVVEEAVEHPVFKFLLGEGELEGCSFGELRDCFAGDFWWRKCLREALAALPSSSGLTIPDELREAVQQVQMIAAEPTGEGGWSLSEEHLRERLRQIEEIARKALKI